MRQLIGSNLIKKSFTIQNQKNSHLTFKKFLTGEFPESLQYSRPFSIYHFIKISQN